MGGRGNKRPGVVAKIIFASTVAMAAVALWLGIVGIQKEPRGPGRGDQALPARAAAEQLSPTHPQ